MIHTFSMDCIITFNITRVFSQPLTGEVVYQYHVSFFFLLNYLQIVIKQLIKKKLKNYEKT